MSCPAHAVIEKKSRAAGWDGFVGSSPAAAVLLLQIFFFSSPGKDGNAVKIWLLWDAAARHFVQLCIHTVLGSGARESFVCELCSCERWDFPEKNFKDPSRSQNQAWSEEAWFEEGHKATFGCRATSQRPQKQQTQLPAVTASPPVLKETLSSVHLQIYAAIILLEKKLYVVACVQCLGGKVWKHSSGKWILSAEIVLCRVSSKGEIYTSDLTPAGIREKIPLEFIKHRADQSNLTTVLTALENHWISSWKTE